MRRVLLVICLFCCLSSMTKAETEVADTAVATTHHGSLFKRVTKAVGSVFDVDTAYIRPQQFSFQTMMQNSYSYEVYRLSDEEGNSIRFEPKPSMKIGPYIGWSLIFLGWTVDVLHLNDGNTRKEFDISLYTLPVGIDIFYRQSGDNYTIQEMKLNGDYNTTKMNGIAFDGIKSSVTGANLYYIFNHRHFSYPAAFNQSTQQRISCGSPLAGLGFTRHSLSIDWKKFDELATERIGVTPSTIIGDELTFEKVTYTDLSASGGYGYNWVFAKNWLFASSLSLALSYKRSISDSEHGLNALNEGLDFRDFKFSDLTLDGVGRFGVVWNNSRWFAGMSAIIHSYNYSKSRFYTNNVFGSFNIYAGFNFVRKKKK